jgi:integrase
MAVRKLKNSWWVDFQYAGKRYRKRSPLNTRAGALEYEVLLRQKLSQGIPIDNNPVGSKKQNQLLEDFTREWFEVYVKNNNKPSEQRQKELTLRAHLLPFFGKTPINRITSLQIERYKAIKAKEGLALKTVNNHLTILAKCLNTAKEWIGLESVPQIKKFRVPPSKFNFLTQEESEMLLAHAHGIYRTMILVALKTGLRLGELNALMWQDINLDKKILIVRRNMFLGQLTSPKNNRERKIPLVDRVCDALRPIQKKTGFVFVDESGEPLKAERVRRTLYRTCKAAGLRRTGWHALRHTFASHLVEAGASIKAIQELLGHASIQTTMRYTHVAPSALQDTVDLLEDKKNRKLMSTWRQPMTISTHAEQFERVRNSAKTS